MYTATLTMGDLDFQKPEDAAAHLLEVAGWARPLGLVVENQHTAERHWIEVTEPSAPDNRRDDANDTVDAMVRAESFISGFEDDETQEGVADILLGLRTAIAVEQAAPDMLAALKLICEARDHCAETGIYPAGLLGEDQQFDDWAADIASAAIAKAETIRA